MTKQKAGKKPRKEDDHRPATAAPREKTLPSVLEGTHNRHWQIFLAILALILIPVWVFWPVLGYDFVNWDDPLLVVDNPQIKNLSPEGLKEIFLSSAKVSNYYMPLTFLSFSLDYALFGLDPGAFHRVNLLIHVLNGLLVFYFFYLLSRNAVWAFGGAALFSVHPLNVEAVAWVTERKGLLAAFFLLLSLLAYVRHLDKGTRYSYPGAILFFFLSLLSKPVGLMFPFILFLLDYFRGRKWNLSLICKKLPFLLGGLLFAVQAFWGQESGGAMGSRPILSVDNLPAAAYGLLLYVSKFFYPAPLSVFYPYPPNPSFFYPVLIVFWLGGIFFLRNFREFFFGQVFFLIALLPAAKLVPFGDFVAADRLVYFPLLGFFFLAGWAFSWIESRMPGRNQYRRGLVFLPLVLVLGIFAEMSRERLVVWQNGEELWKNVLAVFPQVPVAHVGLGDFYVGKGRWEEGTSEYRKALDIDPRNAIALSYLGNAYRQKGRSDEAMESYKKALDIVPYSRTYLNLGMVYEQKGMLEDAVTAYLKVLEIEPRSGQARTNLGAVYLRQGWVDMALEEQRRAVALDPSDPLIHNNLGTAYRRKGLLEEAIQSYRKAIGLNPRYAPAYTNLGLAYEQKGQLEEALSFHRRAVEIDPASAVARTNLGAAYMRKGMVDQAIEEHRQAVALDPASAMAHANLGAAYGQKGMLDEAIAELKQALLLDPRYAKAHYNLAVAYVLKKDRKLADYHFGRAAELGPQGTAENPRRNQP